MDTGMPNYPYARPEAGPPPLVRGPTCQDALAKLKSRLHPLRYATCWVKWIYAQGVILTLVVQDYLLFTAGIGQSGTPAGVSGNLTLAETDALDDGTLVDGGQRFIIEGLGCAIGHPHVLSEAGAIVLPSDLYTDDPDSYANHAARKTLELCSIVAKQGTDGCDIRLGRPDQWPPAGQAGQAHSAETLPGRFTFLADRLVSWGKDTVNKLQVTVRPERAAIINANGSRTLTTSVYVPLTLSLWGWAECLAPGLSDQQMEQAGQLLKVLGDVSPEKLQAALALLRSGSGS